MFLGCERIYFFVPEYKFSARIFVLTRNAMVAVYPNLGQCTRFYDLKIWKCILFYEVKTWKCTLCYYSKIEDLEAYTIFCKENFGLASHHDSKYCRSVAHSIEWMFGWMDKRSVWYLCR